MATYIGNITSSLGTTTYLGINDIVGKIYAIIAADSNVSLISDSIGNSATPRAIVYKHAQSTHYIKIKANTMTVWTTIFINTDNITEITATATNQSWGNTSIYLTIRFLYGTNSHILFAGELAQTINMNFAILKGVNKSGAAYSLGWFSYALYYQVGSSSYHYLYGVTSGTNVVVNNSAGNIFPPMQQGLDSSVALAPMIVPVSLDSVYVLNNAFGTYPRFVQGAVYTDSGVNYIYNQTLDAPYSTGMFFSDG
ncbi:MAG: hypothetical protein P4L35_19380 [Ignavibacteriaceae bacterium]|nr:hypothetical protein [Ignavibacteriaceae bacterium]